MFCLEESEMDSVIITVVSSISEMHKLNPKNGDLIAVRANNRTDVYIFMDGIFSRLTMAT